MNMKISINKKPRRYINRNYEFDALCVAVFPADTEATAARLFGKFGAAYVRVLEVLPLGYVPQWILFKLDSPHRDWLAIPTDTLTPLRINVNRAMRVAYRVNQYLCHYEIVPF